jgi:hypothetical protein
MDLRPFGKNFALIPKRLISKKNFANKILIKNHDFFHYDFLILNLFLNNKNKRLNRLNKK